MILSTQVPDAGTPIFNAAGYIDPVWHNFFSTILRRTGGSAGIDAEDAPAIQGSTTDVAFTFPFESTPLEQQVASAQVVAEDPVESLAPNHGQQSDPILHDVVTTSANGFMSYTDKAKLDGLSVAVMQPVALIADVLTQNTTADAAILAFTMPAASIVAGTTLAVRLYGITSSGASAGTLSVWIKLGATKVSVQTFTLPATAQPNIGLVYTASITVRSVGASGTMQVGSVMTSSSNALNAGPGVGTAGAGINTTIANTFTVGWNWSVASAANIATAKNATFILEKQQ